MKKQQIKSYKKQLEYFLHVTRVITWCSILLATILFFLSVLLYYKHMLPGAMLSATFGLISFQVLYKYTVIICKWWLRSRGVQEDVLLFLDEEMKGRSKGEFFRLLEQALKIVEDANPASRG